MDPLISVNGLIKRKSFESLNAKPVVYNFYVFGVMNVTRAILPHFRSNKSGTVVNISSGAGRVTTPILSVYSASKFAIEGFTESLAFELDSQNIKVKIVEPGYIATTFYERANGEFAFSTLPDYQQFSDEMASFFKSFSGEANLFTSEDFARVIYTAMTDGTHQLRYVAGPDVEPLFDLRNSAPDQEYVDCTGRYLYLTGLEAENKRCGLPSSQPR